MILFRKLPVFVMVVLIVSSCGSWNQSMPQQQPDSTQAPAEIKLYSNDEPELLEDLKQGVLPPLEGGSEKSQRLVKPASNRMLANQYPNILALHAPFTSKQIALTFDDGPDTRFTPQVLDVLEKHEVKATFFLVGARVAALPDITRQINEYGHIIGSHSYWHPKLYQESSERLDWEIRETDQAIVEIIGYRPSLFRPPYGGLTASIVEQLGAQGKSIVGWSVDSEDWRQLPAQEVEDNILNTVHPGAIILMHSAGDWTQDLSGMVTALDSLIPKLKQQGYELVTIPELLNIYHKQ